MDLLQENYGFVKNLGQYLKFCGLNVSSDTDKALSFLFKITVCKDELKRTNSKTGETIGTPNFGNKTSPFEVLLEATENHAKMNSKIFNLHEFKNNFWVNFHELVGSEFLFHLLTNCSLFVISGKNFVQISGKAFAADNSNLSKRKVRKRKKRPKKHQIVEETSAIENHSLKPNRHRKKSKRRKKESLHVISEIKIPELFSAYELQPPNFAFSRNLRQCFISRNLSDNIDTLMTTILGDVVPLFHANHPILHQLRQVLVDFQSRKHKLYLPGLLDCRLPLPNNWKSLKLEDLVQLWIKPKFVSKFLRSLFGRFCPAQFLGDKNTVKFVEFMSTRFSTIRRRESITVRDLRKLISIKNVTWLRSIPHPNVQRYLLLSALILLMKVMADLVRCCFYVTESQHMRNRLLFYRKPLWMYVVHLGNKHFRSVCKLKEISSSKVIKWTKQHLLFGPFSLRFIPKSAGIRPIIITRSNSSNGNLIARVNWKLQPVKAVLNAIAKSNPRLLGSGLTDRDFARRLWRDLSQNSISKNGVLMVKADLDSCFDNIDQNRLYDILKEIVHTCMDEKKMIVQDYRSFQSRRYGYMKKRRKIVAALQNDTKLSDAVMSSSKMVSVPTDSYQEWSPDQLLKWLHSLLCRHVISLGGKFYLQTRGIPQGFAISVILCNIYLGQMEQFQWPKLVSDKTQDNTILMRLMDDFLLATTNWDIAQSFLLSVTSGTKKFGVRARTTKTVTNFQCTATQGYSVVSGQENIPWCGLKFSPQMLQVYPDVSRWSDVSARDMVTLRRYKKRLSPWLCDTIERSVDLRAPRICFDETINTNETINKNLNEMCTLARKVATVLAKELKIKDERTLKYLMNEARKRLSLRLSVLKRN